MKKIIVLGGGRQGRVVAGALARDFMVTLADRVHVGVTGAKSLVADLSDAGVVERLVAQHDLAVGALPAELGFNAARAAVAAKRSYVDIAFYAEEAAELDAEAKRARVAVVPDAGLAPGLSNLVTGRAVAALRPRAVHIKVGGVAADPSRPFGYVISWSVDDLMTEFVRPARIRRAGKVVSAAAMSELEEVDIPGLGRMEAFLTDGLRTLLSLEVPEMTEKTLRWPGHVAAIRPLVENGTLAERLRRECNAGQDVVAFRIDVDGETVVMVDHAQGGLSAMARTTALTCACFAKLLAQGGVREHGVVAPELIGRDVAAYRALLDALAEHHIVLTPRYPFV